MMDRDGRNVRQLTVDPAPDTLPSVSPDGRYVVFTTIRAGASQIWRMDIDGGNSRALTKGPQDGFPMIVDGGRAVAFSMGAFTADGRAFTYVDDRAGVSNIWSYPVAGGSAKPLTSLTSDLIFQYAWSPNGRELAMARGTRSSDVVLITSLDK